MLKIKFFREQIIILLLLRLPQGAPVAMVAKFSLSVCLSLSDLE